MKLSELEVKIALESKEFSRVFADCLKHYGEPQSHIIQLDKYYDTPDTQLRAQDLVLRIRTINGKHQVALKSPRVNLPSGCSKRIELEFAVEEGDKVLKQLDEQGLSPIQMSEKERWTFVRGDIEILLDRLPFIGCFIEVEGPHEAAIEAVLKELGLTSHPKIQKNYGELMREKLKALNLSHHATEATFANEQRIKVNV